VSCTRTGQTPSRHAGDGQEPRELGLHRTACSPRRQGLKITIDAVNKGGVALYGNPGTDTGSVKIIADRINEIIYKKNGKMTQVLTNALSPDGTTIGVTYMRMNAEGKTTGVTFATYEKMP